MVAEGAPIMMVELMKMEIRSPTAGRVTGLRCPVGRSVKAGDIVAPLETA